jgi:hypothetical protein
MVKTKNTVSTHKPLNLNCSLIEKSLMCGSFNVQQGKDKYEYNVFGSPNQKIGQFASQTKLGEWS